MSWLAFLDTETVTLEPGHDVVWEIAIITRDTADHEWLFQVRPNTGKAHPEALAVSRFEERYALTGTTQAAVAAPGGGWTRLTLDQLAAYLRVLLTGRCVWGSTPGFDIERLSLFLRHQTRSRRGTPAVGYRDPWHYSPQDVKALVAGYLLGYGGEEAPAELLTQPWKADELFRAVGVEPDGYDRHTGLGDARLYRDVYDAVHGKAAIDA